MHPGQFAVLSSDSDRVVENAITDLSIHAFILDAMGLPHTPFHAINIHGGKRDRASRLIDVIKSLPSNIRSRLTLENDESSYSVSDLLEIHLQTNVPIVFDTHHHTFNEGGLTQQIAHDATYQTWASSGVRPLQHISNTQPGLENGSFPDRRKHSDYIHTVPETQLAALRENIIDVEVEAKCKQRALFKMASDFNIPV
jgi:UV DNA damage endonuclease